MMMWCLRCIVRLIQSLAVALQFVSGTIAKSVSNFNRSSITPLPVRIIL